MTDVTVETGVEMSADELAASKIFEVKLKGYAGSVTINTDDLGNDVYRAIFQLGLDALYAKANGATKALAGITKLEGKALEDRKAEVKKAADKTTEQLVSGIIPGAKAPKASGAVNTEALRLAKNMVRDLIKSSGQKVGAYSAKELTAAAKVVFERNPHLVKLAEKNLAERATEAKGSKALDL